MPRPFQSRNFGGPRFDEERFSRGQTLYETRVQLASVAQSLSPVVDAFVRAHQTFFRGGRIQQRPTTTAALATAAKARRILARAVELGVTRSNGPPPLPPSERTDDNNDGRDIDDLTGLCVSLDRLVRHLVLTSDNLHTALLWDAACTRDALNRQARATSISQGLRATWDRTYFSLRDVARGNLHLVGRDHEFLLFFPQRAFPQQASSRPLSAPPFPGLRPPSSHDTVDDDDGRYLPDPLQEIATVGAGRNDNVERSLPSKEQGKSLMTATINDATTTNNAKTAGGVQRNRQHSSSRIR